MPPQVTDVYVPLTCEDNTLVCPPLGIFYSIWWFFAMLFTPTEEVIQRYKNFFLELKDDETVAGEINLEVIANLPANLKSLILVAILALDSPNDSSHLSFTLPLYLGPVPNRGGALFNEDALRALCEINQISTPHSSVASDSTQDEGAAQPTVIVTPHYLFFADHSNGSVWSFRN